MFLLLQLMLIAKLSIGQESISPRIELARECKNAASSVTSQLGLCMKNRDNAMECLNIVWPNLQSGRWNSMCHDQMRSACKNWCLANYNGYYEPYAMCFGTTYRPQGQYCN